MSPVLFCLFPVPRSLFPIPCSSFPVPYSLFFVSYSLFFVSCSLFPVPCLSVHLVDVNKARQTDRQTLPSSSGCRTSLLDSSCFIPFLRSTIAFLRARKWRLFHIYSSTFIYVILFLKQIYPFSIFLIIFKLCIYAESISLNHKNYKFLDCDCFQKLTLSINLLAKLLSDSLLWDSSISQLHLKL